MESRIITRFALILALGVLPLAAQRPRPEPRPAQGPDVIRLMGRLGLDEAQQKQVKALVEKARAEAPAQRQALQEARKAFGEAAKNPGTDPAQLHQLHQTLSERQFEVQLHQRSLRQEIQKLLTPEQREKAARALGRLEGRRGEMGMGDRPGRPMVGMAGLGGGLGPGREGLGPGLLRGRIADALKLTEAQKKAFEDLRATQAESMKGKVKAAQEARKTLMEATRKPESQREDLKALHRKVAEGQFEVLQARRNAHQAVLKLLSPAQREPLARFQGRMEGRRAAQLEGREGGGMQRLHQGRNRR